MKIFQGMTKADITELLGGSKVLGKPKDLNDLAEEGLPKQALVVFMQKINLDERRLFTYLDVTKRTLDNYKPKERLRLYISDRLIHLAELYAKGKEIFSSLENFNEWLNRPSIDFLGEKPIDLINTRRGIDEILKTLGRIEHGILA
jgi:putative toxin-antitoxin system antitoxin component (TIGR02293 family)